MPPGPAYMQQRGSGGNPRTHWILLLTSLFWRHSPLPLPAPREITIKLKSISPCVTLVNYSAFFLLTSAHLSHHPSPPSLLMTDCRHPQFLPKHHLPSNATFSVSPLDASLSMSAPCLFSFSDTDVSQLLLSHRPTTCTLDHISSSLLQAIAPDILLFVTSLVKSYLSSGCFPSSFWKAYITPLLKKPTIQNKHLVSLLPFISKTL